MARRAAKVLVALLAVLVLVDQYGWTHCAFGVLEARAPKLFPPATHLNRVLKYDEAHSWLTALPVGSQSVELEHLVAAEPDDLKRLGLPPGDFLFSSLDVKEPVARIELSHSYRGRPLEVVGTYFFLPGAHAHDDWRIEPATGQALPHEPFGWVRIYRAPAAGWMSRWLPERAWFGAGMSEHLVVVPMDAESAPLEMSFDLEWHVRSTLWWQLLTVT